MAGAMLPPAMSALGLATRVTRALPQTAAIANPAEELQLLGTEEGKVHSSSTLGGHGAPNPASRYQSQNASRL